MKSKHKRLIQFAFAIFLLVLLIWYYMPIRVSQEISVQSSDGKSEQLSMDITISRRLIGRASLRGTLALGDEAYSIKENIKDESPGWGVQQFFQNAQGERAYHATLQKDSDDTSTYWLDDIGSLWVCVCRSRTVNLSFFDADSMLWRYSD